MSKFDATSEMPYEKLVSKLAVVKSRLGRPLTLSEKVLYSHLDDPAGQDIVRGESYLRLRPDRVAILRGGSAGGRAVRREWCAKGVQ